MIKSSGLIDTRKYDDYFLLAKILLETKLSDEEKEVLMKHFERTENNVYKSMR